MERHSIGDKSSRDLILYLHLFTEPTAYVGSDLVSCSMALIDVKSALVVCNGGQFGHDRILIIGEVLIVKEWMEGKQQKSYKRQNLSTKKTLKQMTNPTTLHPGQVLLPDSMFTR